MTDQCSEQCDQSGEVYQQNQVPVAFHPYSDALVETEQYYIYT